MSLHKVVLCNEMIKLRNMLDERDIAWNDQSTIVPEERLNQLMQDGFPLEYCDTSVYRTHFVTLGIQFSVINGYSTYGGYSPSHDKNDGLLELAVLDGEDRVYGYMTAQDVFDKINEIKEGQC